MGPVTFSFLRVYEDYGLGKICLSNVPVWFLVTSKIPDGIFSRPRLAVFALSKAQTKTSLRLTKTITHKEICVLFL